MRIRVEVSEDTLNYLNDVIKFIRARNPGKDITDDDAIRKSCEEYLTQRTPVKDRSTCPV